jgi:hypothetical protein
VRARQRHPQRMRGPGRTGPVDATVVARQASRTVSASEARELAIMSSPVDVAHLPVERGGSRERRGGPVAATEPRLRHRVAAQRPGHLGRSRRSLEQRERLVEERRAEVPDRTPGLRRSLVHQQEARQHGVVGRDLERRRPQRVLEVVASPRPAEAAEADDGRPQQLAPSLAFAGPAPGGRHVLQFGAISSIIRSPSAWWKAS